MFYYELDYESDSKYFHKLVSSRFDYGYGLGWDKNKSPVFSFQVLESVLVEEGDCYNPPQYDVDFVEILEVRPRLKFPKR